MKNILVVGDSLTYGYGCDDRKPDLFPHPPYPDRLLPASKFAWPSLIEGHNVINKAVPGNCQFGILNSILDYYNVSTDIDVIVFAGTFESRIPLAGYDRPDTVTNWVLADENAPGYEEYKNARKNYVKYLFNSRIAKVSLYSHLLAAYSFATLRNIKFFWSSPQEIDLCGKNTWLKEIEHLKFAHNWQYDYSTNHNVIVNREYISDDGYHPNELGHRTYFDKVIKTELLSMIA